ncbi:MAG TPA: nucleotide pyrophosphohydrolase [Arachidicoccus sp.]|nr:nucleotide pyrophosphohydrolase [Arachidicoccus sp.]
MTEITEIIQKLIKFRDERDWQQFHNSKDLSLAISIEAAELLELFLWKGNENVDIAKLKDELADILSFCFLLAEKHKLSIPDIMKDKIAKNGLRYPASKSKGNAKKYTEL